MVRRPSISTNQHSERLRSFAWTPEGAWWPDFPWMVRSSGLGDESPEHGNFSPESLGGGTVRMVLTVADLDAIFERALTAGASKVVPVGEEHGWRLGRVVDPFGHHWEIGRPLVA